MSWNAIVPWLLCAIYAVQLIGAISLRYDLIAAKFALLCLALGLFLGLVLGLIILVKLAILFVGAENPGGPGAMLFMMVLAMLPATFVLATIVPASNKVPSIHDISTNPESPHAFEFVSNLREASDNPLSVSTKVAELQQKFYPDVKPLHLSATPEAVYAKAKALAWQQGWLVSYEEDTKYRIEATARTPLLRFKDDILIQVSSSPNGSVVHMRSASRVGRSDLGVNAKRIQHFLGQLAASW